MFVAGDVEILAALGQDLRQVYGILPRFTTHSTGCPVTS